MNIGIIGYGFVGKAMHKTFEHNADFFIIDPKKNGNTIQHLSWVINPEITFVCLPAPTLADGTVDPSIICTVFQELMDQSYKGIVVLKSTVTPDIIDDLFNKFAMNSATPLRIVYSPEFLREAHWEQDALSARQIIMAGNWHDCNELKLAYTRHSHINPKPKFHFTDYKTAALAKYAINTFLATKVVFMNQMHALLKEMNNDNQPEGWSEFVDMLNSDHRIGYSHMDVPGADRKFGYGGSCFPKDVKALIGFDKAGHLSLVREAELANTKIRLQNSVNDSKFG